jgi:hypothetical protein
MREHVSHLKVLKAIAALNEFRDLGDVGKIKLRRKRCLKIGFKKLAVPTSTEHEVHINLALRCALRGAAFADLFARCMWRRKTALALTLDQHMSGLDSLRDGYREAVNR